MSARGVRPGAAWLWLALNQIKSTREPTGVFACRRAHGLAPAGYLPAPERFRVCGGALILAGAVLGWGVAFVVGMALLIFLVEFEGPKHEEQRTEEAEDHAHDAAEE